MSQVHREPAPDVDGTPTCSTCRATRFRDRDGWAECLGCGDRYIATKASAAEAEQWAAATPAPHTGGIEYTEPVSTPGSAPARGKKGGWAGVIAVAVIAVAVWAIFFRGSAPDDCMTQPASDAADLAKNLSASDFGTVAAIRRDGGTYIAATVLTQGAVTVVWFQTPSGTTYSVGPITALYSNFPDSAAHTKARVGTDGYDDAKACVAS